MCSPFGEKTTRKTRVANFYSSSYFTEPTLDPLLEQDSYARLDASVTFQSPGERWAIDVIGKNLTSESIRTYGAAWPRSAGSFVVQRQETSNVAVQLRYNW